MIKYFLNQIIYMILKMKYGKSIQIAKLSNTHLLPRIRISDDGEIVIGKNFMCDRNVCIESCGGKITIGDNVFLNSNVKVVSMEDIQIDNRAIIAPNVCIYDHDHNYRGKNKIGDYVVGKIHIGNNVWIGASSIILKSADLGSECVIGAGCVVKERIPNNSIFIQKRENRTILIKDKDNNE